MKAKIAVLIPTLNEEATIGSVIDRVPAAALFNAGCDITVFVIDGDSKDSTRKKALERGAVVLTVAQPGKGAAIRHAFSSIEADYFIMLDGDGTYPPERITDFLRLLQTCDVVLGSRLKGKIADGAMTRKNHFGNQVLTALARTLFKKEITDLCTGFWGWRGYVIDRMELVAQGFEIEADMFVECARHDFSFGEVAIDYYKREDRPKLSSTSDGLKIGLFLLKRWLTVDGRRAR
jgi:dolichol-phosphate mannosyltransferase